MSYTHITYYSRGYVAEILGLGESPCSSWLLLPAENLWAEWLRAILYIIALANIFVGIAISSDIFMCSIEVITAKKRKVAKWDAEKNGMIEKEVLIWNETVANLTLMALGSSAPEILLAIIETVSSIGDEEPQESLGTFTIVGSAAFNLLIITAVCIVSVPKPQSKSIKEFGVFVVTGIWSIWAYVWMILVVKYITPGQIDPWEAWVTLGFLPLLIMMAYFQDLGWCCSRKKVGNADAEDPTANVRVVTAHPHGQLTGHTHKELHSMEAQKAHRNSEQSASPSPQRSLEDKINKSSSVNQARASRFRFRHAVVGTLLGSKAFRPSSSRKTPRMADVAHVIKSWNDAEKEGKPPDVADLVGKFTFGSDRYAVLESAGTLNVDIFFHRVLPPHEKANNNKRTTVSSKERITGPGKAITNGNLTVDTSDDAVAPTTPSNVTPTLFSGGVSIDFETREGSAKPGKDFRYTQGTLMFNNNEYRKTITIPIINDNQYEADVDFYIILKNPRGAADVGNPSVTRVTIVDDDEPGQFEFEDSHYYVDSKTGKVTLRVMREHGFDGKVSMDYSTSDGSAVGGKTLGTNVDYIATNGTLHFEHGDTSKSITFECNKNVKESKNFVLALRNPSLGALIGVKCAAVCHFNKDELIDRVADALEEEDDKEEITWSGQFVNAMTVNIDNDDEGNKVDPKWYHYLMHFISLPWKLFCSLIPPTTLGGAWPTFVLSLFFIGAMTAVVEQLGHLIGCVIGIKTSVTGITIIALGTSLPDTFASRTAALQDENADAAIGNVTGSNCVNVFLGLGLPWVISTMYHLAKGTTFRVQTENLVQSVVIFSIVGTICLVFLGFRRKFMGGELGGSNTLTRIGSSFFLLSLWFIYVLLSSLKAYSIIDI